MDEEEIALLTGFLTVKTQNGFSIRISKKPKYCQLFKASRNGIERLEISDSENDKNTRIVTLENCVKIVLEQSPVNIINIVTKTGQIQLHHTNDGAVKQWKLALQSVAFKEKSIQSSNLNRNANIEEDNDLYCSSYSEGIFTVTLIPTDASIKSGLESKMYTLMLSNTEIHLKSYDDETIIIAKWPYRFIRKYGYRDGKFTFEAGRKCDTGEGTFKLDNVNPQEIFRCMSTKMKSMKKSITGDNFNNQLSVVLSMEPGSRSPLPPTPQSSFIDGDSHNPLRGIRSSPDISSSTCSSNTLCLKNGIPSKPPRKMVPSLINQSTLTLGIDKGNNSANVSSIFVQNNSSIDDLKEITDLVICNNSVPLPIKVEREYECVEDITDAWKKLGVVDINHTENFSSSEDELKAFARQRSKPSRDFPFNYRSEQNVTNEDNIKSNQYEENYDKLDFFRATHKVSSGYKTIIPIKIQTANFTTPTISDDYEIVGEPIASSIACRSSINNTKVEFDSNAINMNLPDTSVYRKADDSYLGYGIIRKSTSQSQYTIPVTNNTLLNKEHEKQQSIDYTAVSKPRRV